MAQSGQIDPESGQHTIQVWAKPLAPKTAEMQDWAVLLLNRGLVAAPVAFHFDALPGANSGSVYTALDLWADAKPLGHGNTSISAHLAATSAEFYKIKGE